ncbi:MAG: DUF5658 family protein [Nitrososphaerales archaeon]|nr:DUF5658 family protein [Nitrososphaerales archaeon]
MARSFSTLYPWERRMVQGIDLAMIQKFLVPLYVAFILLNFSDALTTLVAMTRSLHFVELNPFASTLFKMQLPGFAYAIFMKYVPAVPLFFMVFVRDEQGNHDVEVRLLKFAAFVVLAAADIYLGYIVLGNNLPKILSVSG